MVVITIIIDNTMNLLSTEGRLIAPS